MEKINQAVCYTTRSVTAQLQCINGRRLSHFSPALAEAFIIYNIYFGGVVTHVIFILVKNELINEHHLLNKAMHCDTNLVHEVCNSVVAPG